MFRRKSFVLVSTPQDDQLPEFVDLSRIRGMLGEVSSERLYRTQPHLRTVISFRARNVAQLGLHTYKRVSDTDRRRLRDNPVALLLGRPNSAMTTAELVHGIMSDRDLYDFAALRLVESADAPSGFELWPIPPSWVQSQGGGTAWEPSWVDVAYPNGRREKIPTKELLIFHGWNPGHPNRGASPIDALKDVLAEQIQANAYRQQVWQRAGRVGTVITRPAGVPWSDSARERFSQEWRAKWAGNNGPEAGGDPILEDGMTLSRIGFSAKEDEWIEGVKLSLSTVAQVYHVNPTMVGILDNANYSNVKEFRRMLYGDSLGPDISAIEDRINTFLVPRVTDEDGVYVEFNIAEKLRGSFEEQAAAMQTAIGRPWMTADEGRALQNMTSLGGDAAELVTPLNVLVGGQASATDSAPPPKRGPVRTKARAGESYQEKVAEVLSRFFKRQSAAVLSALGSKAAGDWWDEDRWNRELSDDLFALALLVANEVGSRSATELGFSAEDYDPDRTEAFLRAVAESRAALVNDATRDRIEKALSSEDPDQTPAHVFEEAQSARVPSAAAALVTTFSAFATAEAGKQLAPTVATKTWVVTSSNPRPTHARMNGETVPVGEKFSNGADWPGDPGLGADEVAGCECAVEVRVS